MEKKENLYDYILLDLDQDTLANRFAAGIWLQDAKINHIHIDQNHNTIDHPNILEKIKNKKILVIMITYYPLPDIILNTVKSMNIFYQFIDENIIQHPEITYYKAPSLTGFCTFTVKTLQLEKEQYISEIATRLDEYYYGFPSNDSITFVTVFKMKREPSNDDIVITTALNKSVEAIQNLNIQNILAKTVLCEIQDVNRNITYVCAISVGDTMDLVHTCTTLANRSPDGIGIFITYDFEKQRKEYYIRKNQKADPNLNMKDFMNRFIKCKYVRCTDISVTGYDTLNMTDIQSIFGFEGLSVSGS